LPSHFTSRPNEVVRITYWPARDREMSGDGEWGRDTLSPFTWMCEKEINNRDGLKTNVIFD